MISSRNTRNLSRLSNVLMVAACGLLAAASSRADDVLVELASGRTLIGQIDPRTDPETLWLRTVRGDDMARTVLRRPIDWRCVLAAKVGDKKLSADEFRARAESLKSPLPVFYRIEMPVAPNPEQSLEAIPPGIIAANHFVPPPAPCPVRSLQLDACLGHWTSNVEVDGILLTIYPLDAHGLVTPIDGTLEVDLIGEQPVGAPQGDVFPRLAHWTEAVRACDFDDGVRFELPFQAEHPDFNHQIGHLGVLHARLSVPGQGTFEASLGQIRIRQYSAVRDRYELTHGTRFFPVERTGRGK